jgi:colanic acid/amylovoran biosynthesis glycosyltransferase
LILLLFTSSYPYDIATEQTFLGEEVKHLAEKFEHVVLVPKSCKGKRLPLPDGVDVDTSFAASYSLENKLFTSFLSLFSMDFYRDLKEQWPNSFSVSYLRRLLSFLTGAYLTRIWVQNWLASENVLDTSAIFYTYWFDEIAMGIGMAKKKYPGLRVISRAHGYDLYEELYEIWPCRRKAISMLDGLFSASEAGERYLHEKYPIFAEKYGVALLGVHDPGAVSNPSTDDVLRVVSCSMLNPIKRIVTPVSII